MAEEAVRGQGPRNRRAVQGGAALLRGEGGQARAGWASMRMSGSQVVFSACLPPPHPSTLPACLPGCRPASRRTSPTSRWTSCCPEPGLAPPVMVAALCPQHRHAPPPVFRPKLVHASLHVSVPQLPFLSHSLLSNHNSTHVPPRTAHTPPGGRRTLSSKGSLEGLRAGPLLLLPPPPPPPSGCRASCEWLRCAPAPRRSSPPQRPRPAAPSAVRGGHRLPAG